MGNHHHISQEIKEVALKMSQEGLSDEKIEQVLGIGGQIMRQLRVLHYHLAYSMPDLGKDFVGSLWDLVDIHRALPTSTWAGQNL